MHESIDDAVDDTGANAPHDDPESQQESKDDSMVDHQDLPDADEANAQAPKRPKAVAAPGEIDPELVEPAAVEVVQQLRENDFQAYLVGGCVRDLLLGLTPKDFDVATNATPEEVRKVFRRSRTVGRRFRIVHVLSLIHISEPTRPY